MKLEIKNVSVGSIVTSPVPLMLFFLSFLGGFVKFFVMPDPQFLGMNAGQKLLSVLLFSLIYVVISTAVVVFAVFVYNFFCGALGMRGVQAEIEETQAGE